MGRGERISVRFSLYRAQGGFCLHCGRLMLLEFAGVKALEPLFATIDHIIPQSLGGTDDKANLQLLCKYCNEAKGNKLATGLFEACAA